MTLPIGGFAEAWAGERQSLIEQVYVLDSTASQCLSCSGGEVPKEVQRVVSSADTGAYGTWLQQRFTFNDDWWDDRFKRGDPAQIFTCFNMDTNEGVRFQAQGFRIEFEKFECRIWDCYKPRMWRIDDSDGRAWKRKVPFADAPVQPFIVGDYIVYVGGYTSVSELIILDVVTGQLVESFAPEGEKRGFWDASLLLSPSFYRDGYIYLKGTSETHLDPVTRKPISETPAKTYVLKVRF